MLQKHPAHLSRDIPRSRGQLPDRIGNQRRQRHDGEQVEEEHQWRRPARGAGHQSNWYEHQQHIEPVIQSMGTYRERAGEESQAC